MNRPSDLPIFLFWLSATIVPVLALMCFVALSFWDEATGGTYAWILDGGFLLWMTTGLWFAAVTTVFWRIRQKRCRDSAGLPLAAAWIWGIGCWLLPWGASYAVVGDAVPMLLGAAITAGIVCWTMRSRSFIVISMIGFLFVIALPELVFFLWPSFVFAGLACWSTGAFERCRTLGRCLSCGYSLTGLPANAICPECGGATSRSMRV